MPNVSMFSNSGLCLGLPGQAVIGAAIKDNKVTGDVWITACPPRLHEPNTQDSDEGKAT